MLQPYPLPDPAKLDPAAVTELDWVQDGQPGTSA